jgi:methanogenic corrinoid protein MtbC1
MIAENKALLQGISDAVLGMEEDKVVTLVEQAIKAKIEPLVTIESLTDGIERAGKLFVEEEYFVPELLLCSDAMYAGLELVRPYLDRSVDNSIGKVVPPKNFVDTAIENKAQFIALSTLMTTTMGSMEEVVKLLKDHDSNRQIKVIIGGGPISQGFADRIGAQGYAANAVEAARLFKRLSNN